MTDLIRGSLEAILDRGRRVITPGAPARDPEIMGLFRELSTNLANSEPVQQRPNLRVTWSVGLGRWSKVPWIALLDRRETESTKSGVYCVFLFRQDMSGVYLTFAQGVTEPKSKYGHAEGHEWMRRRAKHLRQWCDSLGSSGFALDDRIDLRTDKGLGKDYEASTIAYRLYLKDQVPPSEEILAHLDAALAGYATYVESRSSDWDPHLENHHDSITRDWIFQANPAVFDVSGAVKALPELHWLVNKYRDQIHSGDRVFLWESGRQAGVVAVATVLTDPTVSPSPEALVPFWKSSSSAEEPMLRVQLRIDRVLEPRLPRQKLAEHEILKDSLIIKVRTGTNLALTPEEAAALVDLIEAEAREPEPIRDLSTVVNQFSSALQASHLNFGQNHEDRVRSFTSALATKRLAILTGLSGSGKTQIAIRLGEWLGHTTQSPRAMLVPVRPDWTGPEPLFGYEDALQKRSEDGRPAWHVPPVLAFMLKAASDPKNPYLLILDEMNLAHVERYFADVLSGMESDQPCLPNLTQEQDGLWRTHPDQEKIPFPRNLFVVGTVNVDETTYMFSPKVLDRASTFEFRVEPGDLRTDLQKPIACERGDARCVKGFLAIASDDQWQVSNPPKDLDAYADHLKTLHSLLYEGGFEFGHRVFYEAIRFFAMYQSAGADEMEHALDLLLMQKVLPRLHGARRRLEPTLCALGRFCFELIYDPGTVESGKATEFNPLGKDVAEARLKTSFDKVRRMTRSLRANQFTSFTEY